MKRLKEKAARIEKFLEENDPKIGRGGKEIKSNVTDNKPANMLTSHGAIQGYNGQALIDKKRQIILHAEAFGEGQDQHHIPPMIDGAKENIEEGRNIYHQRIAIVEPVFANIRHMKGLGRFTLRGKIKVNIQWMLYCMGHNIEKIMVYVFT